MSLISQEDIELIKQKNPQLFFIFGYPGTGQKSQIEKVCKEFRYGKMLRMLHLFKDIPSDINFAIFKGYGTKEITKIGTNS